jgi:hypothetical protein
MFLLIFILIIFIAVIILAQKKKKNPPPGPTPPPTPGPTPPPALVPVLPGMDLSVINKTGFEGTIQYTLNGPIITFLKGSQPISLGVVPSDATGIRITLLLGLVKKDFLLTDIPILQGSNNTFNINFDQTTQIISLSA